MRMGRERKAKKGQESKAPLINICGYTTESDAKFKTLEDEHLRTWARRAMERTRTLLQREHLVTVQCRPSSDDANRRRHSLDIQLPCAAQHSIAEASPSLSLCAPSLHRAPLFLRYRQIVGRSQRSVVFRAPSITLLRAAFVVTCPETISIGGPTFLPCSLAVRKLQSQSTVIFQHSIMVVARGLVVLLFGELS